jgi:hypothetical protein
VDREVVAAATVPFASPRAELGTLEREGVVEVARLAEREGDDVLIWARASDPAQLEEATRRADELRELVVRAGGLPARRVETRVTTRPGGAALEVVVSALHGGSSPAEPAGGAPRRAVRDAVRTAQPSIEACAGEQAARLGAARAEAPLRIAIRADGGVRAVSAADGDLAADGLDACLRKAAPAWRFPAAGAEYEVDVPVAAIRAR